jgi:hypothetical protein
MYNYNMADVRKHLVFRIVMKTVQLLYYWI